MASKSMDTGYSWLVLLSSFTIALIILGQVLNFGIYYVIFLEYFGASRKETSLPGALCYSIMCVIGPISSVLQKRFGARLVVMFGGVLASIGLCASYFASDLWHLSITYGCVCGVGYGLSMTPSMAILPEYFEKYKYFVTSFTAVGAALGSFIFAPLSLYLIDRYTWRGSMLVQAGFAAQIVACGFVCRSRRKYDRSENFSSLFDTDLLLRNRRFLLLLLDGVILGGASFAVFSMINSLMVGRGLSTWQTAQLMSICGLSNMAARVSAAILSPMKCMNRVLLYSMAGLSSAAGIGACVWCFEYWSFAAAVVVFGFSIGLKFSQLPNAIIDLFGVEKMASGFGYVMFSVGFGGFVLPLLAGWLADQTDTQAAFVMTAISCLVGFGFCCLLMFFTPRKSHNSDRSEKEIAVEMADMD